MSDVWLARRLKKVTNRQQDHRDPFQRDRARVMHSASFRRLQSKTQVMGSGQSDFYRTRLTHSLEAAQIGSGITAQLRYKFPELCNALFPTSDSLIETICLAHDIGHPPFGHGGEIALNYMMRDHGGFEGNGQTLRIVARLETFSEHFGMNLTRRTLLGLMKYPQLLETLSKEIKPTRVGNFRQLKANEWHPAKGLYRDDQDIIDWILEPLSQADRTLFQSMSCHSIGSQNLRLQDKNTHHKTRFKSLDCSIMELADDIAYGIHDLEDAIVTKVVNRDDFDREVIKKLQQIDDVWLQEYSMTLTDKLFSDHHHLQKDAIGGLVNYLITAIKLTDLNEQDDINFSEPLLRYNATLSASTAEALKIFKDFVYFYVIKLTSLQRLEYRGQQIVMELFEALSSDPNRLLPSNSAKRWQQAIDNKTNSQRIIADYIAGMTDDYATRLYQSLFNAHGASDYQLN
ncbi:anti-phage deoxyguanosine triphosphatase [Colwellia psychrerythraea]|uniref:Deoxyguanosinetriphosphate triphosphohydrolase-like protein n=1 Tax=Colwellia psychrerythraea (strain 34H / ATCC BAA-681) TaxID=167879 RepID=Q483D1_COLP3|nr:anti-phage deoxyguanosine triphosphatase [Colwellia psychrerythraea]AAZ27543.1 putative deoxyguanosinetriphosphate triphosphohydrolase [Colwellia psychrerythraea 34H]